MTKYTMFPKEIVLSPAHSPFRYIRVVLKPFELGDNMELRCEKLVLDAQGAIDTEASTIWALPGDSAFLCSGPHESENRDVAVT